ncbi:MAG: mechanosensitive ion channel [Campylobacterales bacterium]|nr:mechanosensitive ion channel [Campylobacterales bacterium]
MIPFINFTLVPIQFGYITADIQANLLKNISNETTMIWMGIVASLIMAILFIRIKIKHHWNNTSIIPMFITSFSPFIVIVALLFALSDMPDNSVLIILYSLASFWLAMTLLQMPFKLLNFCNRMLFYTSSSFFALAGSILLFKQLSEIASYNFYLDAVSLFTLLAIVSKLGIITGLYLYGHMLVPTLLNRWSHIFPSWISMWVIRLFLRILFFIFALLWLGNYLNFSLKVLMLVFILSMFIGVFVMIRNHMDWLMDHLYTSMHYTPVELDNIAYNFQKSSFLLFLFFLYTMTPFFPELLGFQKVLQTVILIKTSLLELSLFQLISAIFIFNLLYSLLYIVTKRARLFRMFRDSINVKSLEALTLNLGLLIILILTFMQMDLSWRVFVPIAGALGIGFGFGLQTILNNYMSGFIVLFAKKLRIGDIVELPGNAGSSVGNTSGTIVGTVEAIDILSTTLRTVDGIEISIPNSFFIAEKIINYSQTTPYVRVKIAIGVDYATDLDLAERLIVEAMSECDEIEQEMEKGIIFMQFGSSSLDLAPYFWTNIRKIRGLGVLKGELMSRILSKFREHGVTIPFPRSEITIRNPITINQENTI